MGTLHSKFFGRRNLNKLPVSVPFHWRFFNRRLEVLKETMTEAKKFNMFSPLNINRIIFLDFLLNEYAQRKLISDLLSSRRLFLFLKAIYKSGYQSPKRRSVRYRKAGHATTIGKFFRINMRSAPCIILHGFNLKTGPYPLCLVYYSGDFKDYNT